ncbi:PLP-dependent aspartate aminotransferase family protein [Gracilibacillus phocaeensis]|uniref:PLP-dependent aspartate aminotransferase family protein n=1 Tax=Gracilibacillus phocaeensis TaxID=2042304 RepID=UPI001030F365|nr:PLP-dependent aspartate aminotransferase family protein [Gracilibacillus phocaeensis]
MTNPFQFPKNETNLLHAGQQVDPTTNARAVPIYQTTSYVFNDAEHAQNLFALAETGNIYSRIMNPTVDAFEQRMAILEDGVAAVATASGMSAITLAILNLANSGDEIVTDSNLYGGTYNLFRNTLPNYGINVIFVDGADPENFRKAITPKTKAVFGEVITNPSLNVFDIEAVADIAHENDIPLIIDNTFATPYVCKPISWGADIVVHSATKWIGGHGTTIGGIMIDGGRFNWNNEKFPGFIKPDESYHGIRYGIDLGAAAFALKFRVHLLRDIGPALSPQNAFYFLQGLESLHLRVERHHENAQAVAQYLQKHPQIEWVAYPGLEEHPSHQLAQKYLRNYYGSVITFGIKGGREAGRKLIDNITLWSHVANVGDAKSLIIHPASTTQQQLSAEELEASGTKEELVRLSVGLEAPDDIIADLDQAIAKATNSEPTIHISKEQAIEWALSSPFDREGGDIRPKNILVAGDIDHSIAAVKLQKLGYHVTAANQAEEEIDLLFITDSGQAQDFYSDQAKIVWFAAGQTDADVKAKAEANGQIVVEDKCPFEEADRLRRGK